MQHSNTQIQQPYLGNPSVYPLDHVSESVVSDLIGHPVEFGLDEHPLRIHPRYEGQLSLHPENGMPTASNLLQPRPLNPVLDIHFDNHPIFQEEHGLSPHPVQPSKQPSNSIPAPYIPPQRLPQPYQFQQAQPRRVWRESDYQIVTISPSISSISSSDTTSFHDIKDSEENSPERLNVYLEECGLPTLDFSHITEENKDKFYQDYIFQLAKQFNQHMTFLENKRKEIVVYSNDEISAIDLMNDVDKRVRRMLHENTITTRASLVDNVEGIGHQLRKSTRKLRALETLMTVIESDDHLPPVLDQVETKDIEYDKRYEKCIKRVLHARTYKAKYKELLFLKYKVIEMLNRLTESSIDQFIETEKLLPIIEQTRVPMKRVKDILRTRSFTPEWKIRELIDLFHVLSVCSNSR